MFQPATRSIWLCVASVVVVLEPIVVLVDEVTVVLVVVPVVLVVLVLLVLEPVSVPLPVLKLTRVLKVGPLPLGSAEPT
jgi:hypothetical protein